ncbi:unnamed protein product [Gongylonema pulchrum]|uniref:FSH1 domain-containing protein n=1 Tax=Gongylonema pulchrum TaxID=637853 RepID=A0A183D6Z0_9BILA|nr:unnamed protein product [Gongylonema pulchrum]
MEAAVEPQIRTSVSHPCLSSPSDGPTQILPFLYLGSQQDAMDSKVLTPDALKQEGHFMRIPVNDTYQEKLLPHFEDAFKFLGKQFLYF